MNRPVIRSRRWLRRILIAIVLVPLAIVGVILLAAFRIGQGKPFVKTDVQALPHRKVGLVLGCSPRLWSGAPSGFFENRMNAAAKVFQAGKVDYLLVSGDNHKATYDEPTEMKEALMKRGVPEDRIVLDYAGFSTHESIIRAKEVFALSGCCIISQQDHALRALYIAKANGMDAVVYPAEDIGLDNWGGFRTHAREALARVRTLLDVHVIGRKPKFLGPVVEIGSAAQ